MQETNQDYRVLWLAVIRRAQEEADGRYTYWDEDAGLVRRRAVKWLSTLSVGLCEVCASAGFTPEMVRRLIQDSREKYGI
jgi:hypothetical protein